MVMQSNYFTVYEDIEPPRSAAYEYALNNQGIDAMYQSIRDFVAGNPTPQQLAEAMQTYGVSAQDIASATQYSVNDVAQYIAPVATVTDVYQAPVVNTPAPAPAPEPEPYVPPAAVVPDYSFKLPDDFDLAAAINPPIPSFTPTATVAPTPVAPANTYFATNPDVAAAYAQNSYGLTPDQFAATHYEKYGQSEGRVSPAGTPAPVAPATSTPPSNYVTPAPAPAPTTTQTVAGPTAPTTTTTAATTTKAADTTVTKDQARQAIDAWLTANPKATTDDLARAINNGIGMSDNVAAALADKYSMPAADIVTTYNKIVDPYAGVQVTDYEGRSYDAKQLINLAGQVAKNLDTSKSSGGAFGTSKENIGFDYNTLSSAYGGKAFSTGDQVAFDMARSLLKQGITDYSQIGTVPTYTSVAAVPTYNGNRVYTDEYGSMIAYVPTGGYDSEGGMSYQTVYVRPDQVQTGYVIPGDEYTSPQPVDASKVVMQNGQPVIQSGTTVGNKETGQAIGQNFGATYTGKGNTQYYVDPATGKFHTEGHSSSDLSGGLGLVLSIGASFLMPGVGEILAAELGVSAATGTALANAGLQLAMGADPTQVLLNAGLGISGVTNSIYGAVDANLSNMITDPKILDMAANAVTRAGTTFLTTGDTATALTAAAGSVVNSVVTNTTGSNVLGAGAAAYLQTGDLNTAALVVANTAAYNAGQNNTAVVKDAYGNIKSTVQDLFTGAANDTVQNATADAIANNGGITQQDLDDLFDPAKNPYLNAGDIYGTGTQIAGATGGTGDISPFTNEKMQPGKGEEIVGDRRGSDGTTYVREIKGTDAEGNEYSYKIVYDPVSKEYTYETAGGAAFGSDVTAQEAAASGITITSSKIRPDFSTPVDVLNTAAGSTTTAKSTPDITLTLGQTGDAGTGISTTGGTTGGGGTSGNANVGGTGGGNANVIIGTGGNANVGGTGGGNANVIIGGGTGGNGGGTGGNVTIGGTGGGNANVVVGGTGGTGNANIGGTGGGNANVVVGNTGGTGGSNVITVGNVTTTGNIITVGNTVSNVSNVVSNTVSNVSNVTPNVITVINTPNVTPNVTPITTTFPGQGPNPIKLTKGGLNPGWIAPDVFYQATSPVQSEYYWGAHPYQTGTTFNSQLYNTVPEAPKTPWGLQQIATPLSSAQINAMLAGQPIPNSVIPQTQSVSTWNAPRYTGGPGPTGVPVVGATLTPISPYTVTNMVPVTDTTNAPVNFVTGPG